jgi:hypothetical protein
MFTYANDIDLARACASDDPYRRAEARWERARRHGADIHGMGGTRPMSSHDASLYASLLAQREARAAAAERAARVIPGPPAPVFVTSEPVAVAKPRRRRLRIRFELV